MHIENDIPGDRPMISPAFFYQHLVKHDVRFFTGVPDSLLKSFCAYLADYADEREHIIAVNEGAAVALASGYHLATGKIPRVYMQNSGIGNAVNPLLSLADGDVYRLPLVLVIGWRGEPGTQDEPQHVKQGKVTRALLEAIDIPYAILADSEDAARDQLNECFAHIAATNTAYALLVRKDTFAPYALQKQTDDNAELSREAAIEVLMLSQLSAGVFVSTTGMASRELYELREKHGMGHERDFLTVGSMGHASQIALAVALQKPDLLVTCLDGDGATLMHMGALAAIGAKKPANFRHIVLNNGAHDSVGGQPTIAPYINIPLVASACGYDWMFSASTRAELDMAIASACRATRRGAALIEIKVRKGARKDLGRPKSTPIENKLAFMDCIEKSHNKGVF
jgi:phosphonopyruvate decarboxylase